jgi:hypothetical protein
MSNPIFFSTDVAINSDTLYEVLNQQPRGGYGVLWLGLKPDGDALADVQVQVKAHNQAEWTPYVATNAEWQASDLLKLDYAYAPGSHYIYNLGDGEQGAACIFLRNVWAVRVVAQSASGAATLGVSGSLS